MTEASIIRQARQGDGAAYEELVRRYQTVAFRTAWMILGDADEAGDATQAAFLKAWLTIAQVDPARSFRPWVLTIVANEARNRQRARRRWLARVLPEDRVELLAGSDPSPALQVEQEDEAGTVLRQLAAMDETDRLTLWCRFVLEMSEQETAAVMACAVGTVKSRTHRALARLRGRLQDAGAGEGGARHE